MKKNVSNTINAFPQNVHKPSDTAKKVFDFLKPALICLVIIALYITPSVIHEIKEGNVERTQASITEEYGYRIQGRYELQYGDIPYDELNGICVISDSYDGKYTVEKVATNGSFITYDLHVVLYGCKAQIVGVDSKPIDVNKSTGYLSTRISIPADHSLKQVVIS